MMNWQRVTPQFLASVTSVDEANIAVSGGAGIIDCKDPGLGALGALGVAVVRDIRAAVPRDIPISATIGDLPAEAAAWSGPILEMAATGVEYIKIGIFPGLDARAAIVAIGRLSLGRARLVGVLLADREPDFALVDALADAGFAGVMVDTARKSGQALLDVAGVGTLGEFVENARLQGLFVGLAGSLRVEHIQALAELDPDLLGFRGALCGGHDRRGRLDAARVGAVRDALFAARAAKLLVAPSLDPTSA